MMKTFRQQIEPIECPRCHDKMLNVFIAGKMRESGKLKKTALVTDGHTHPACQWEGRVALISPEEAQWRIDMFKASISLNSGQRSHAELSQPAEL